MHTINCIFFVLLIFINRYTGIIIYRYDQSQLFRFIVINNYIFFERILFYIQLPADPLPIMES